MDGADFVDYQPCYSCLQCNVFSTENHTDLEVAGLPCTDFSKAGQQKREKKTTAPVFIMHAKTHVRKSTPLIVLENVCDSWLSWQWMRHMQEPACVPITCPARARPWTQNPGAQTLNSKFHAVGPSLGAYPLGSVYTHYIPYMYLRVPRIPPKRPHNTNLDKP